MTLRYSSRALHKYLKDCELKTGKTGGLLALYDEELDFYYMEFKPKEWFTLYEQKCMIKDNAVFVLGEQGMFMLSFGGCDNCEPIDEKKLFIEVLAEDGVLRLSPSFTNCSTCFAEDAKGRCGLCRKVRYCNAECQKAHWQIHKITCSPLVFGTTPSQKNIERGRS